MTISKVEWKKSATLLYKIIQKVKDKHDYDENSPFSRNIEMAIKQYDYLIEAEKKK